MTAEVQEAVTRSVPMPLVEAELMDYLDKVQLRRSGPLARMAPEVMREVTEDRLIEARFSYGIYPASRISQGQVRLANGVEFSAPLVAHKMQRSSSLAFAAVTLGSRLSERVSALTRGGAGVRGLIAEGIAGYALYKLVGALCEALDQDALARGLSCSGYINPGDPGFDLSHQRKMLELAHAGQIGITCTERCVMSPVHSVSAVFGLGQAMRKWTQVENCEACPSRDRCLHYKAAAR